MKRRMERENRVKLRYSPFLTNIDDILDALSPYYLIRVRYLQAMFQTIGETTPAAGSRDLRTFTITVGRRETPADFFVQDVKVRREEKRMKMKEYREENEDERVQRREWR